MQIVVSRLLVRYFLYTYETTKYLRYIEFNGNNMKLTLIFLCGVAIERNLVNDNFTFDGNSSLSLCIRI